MYHNTVLSEFISMGIFLNVLIVILLVLLLIFVFAAFVFFIVTSFADDIKDLKKRLK